MRHLVSILILLCSLTRPLAATELHLLPESRLWLEGDSTMHAYTIQTNEIKLNAHIESLQNYSSLSLALAIPVAKMHSDKKGLDKKMRQALKADEAPQITFQLEKLYREKDGVRATGKLTVAGHTEPIELSADVTEQSNRLVVRGTKSLTMTQFGIEPPTAMLGMLKTKDGIMVHFEFFLIANKGGNYENH